MPRERFKTLTEQMFYILLCLARSKRSGPKAADYDRILRKGTLS